MEFIIRAALEALRIAATFGFMSTSPFTGDLSQPGTPASESDLSRARTPNRPRIEFSPHNQEVDTLRANFNAHRNAGKPTVFQAALEGPHAVVGGLGIVVRDLVTQMNRSGSVDCFSVTPLYGYLRQNVLEKGWLSLGYITHKAFGAQKKTQVFFNSVDRQLFLDVDMQNIDCFNAVISSAHVYEPTQSYARIVYYNSVVAALADALDIDVLNTHGYHMAIAQELVKTQVNSARIGREIKAVTVVHMLNGEQGVDDSSILLHAGLDVAEYQQINLMERQIAFADKVITVSRALAADCLAAGGACGLEGCFTANREKVQGNTNGLSHADFDPRSHAVLGEFSLQPDFNEAQLQDSKARAQQYAFDQGLIADPTKPLMLFVGRFGGEKGIEVLPKILFEWISKGGQAVIMGAPTQDRKSARIIKALQRFERENKGVWAGNVKIYAEIAQQTRLLDNGVQAGILLRYAADFTCVPSFAEACGLVAMEALSMGSLVFTSWVQGLKDFVRPLGVSTRQSGGVFTQENFNGISFYLDGYHAANSYPEIRSHVARAWGLVTENRGALVAAQARAIREGPGYDWLAERGAIDTYVGLYGPDVSEKRQVYMRHYPGLLSSLLAAGSFYPSTKEVFRAQGKVGEFIMCTLVNPHREPESAANHPQLKEQSRVTVRDGLLYRGKDLLNTDALPQGHQIWVMNKNGELFIGAPCHAFLLKSQPGKPGYGYAKPVACAGDIRVVNGKIVRIDNRSGHYQPHADQLKLAIRYLSTLDVLAHDVHIYDETPNETRTAVRLELAEITALTDGGIQTILTRYRSL